MMKPSIFAIVLNWNEKKLTEECVNSLLKQTIKLNIVIVDNGSIDGSVEYLQKVFPKLPIVKNSKNLGFSGGENSGINYCLNKGADYIILLNNDALVEPNWAEILHKAINKDHQIGNTCGLLLKKDGKKIDSTGDQYSSWGLAIARQRSEPVKNAISKGEYIFGGTAGASIYRAKALKEVGVFDEKFFAYYEDTDLNFRLQLAGWKSFYEPQAVGYHAIGGTSSKIPYFTTMQTFKNIPMLFFKNVPSGLMYKMLPRFLLVYSLIFAKALLSRKALSATKGLLLWYKNIPHTFMARRRIQNSKKVSNDYIWSIIFKDLPPDAMSLRRFRNFFTGKG